MPASIESAELIKGCIANARPAQEALYKLFYAEMLRLCYRYLKSDTLAEDALNTGFLKIFQNITAYDAQKGELKAWVKTVMVRNCIDIGRREARFAAAVPLEEEAGELFIEPDVLSKLYAGDLLQHIRRLPAATQLVFNLSVLDGYTHKEISGQLNISESTSRWHLTEAKKQLRLLLKEPGSKINNNKGA